MKSGDRRKVVALVEARAAVEPILNHARLDPGKVPQLLEQPYVIDVADPEVTDETNFMCVLKCTPHGEGLVRRGHG